MQPRLKRTGRRTIDLWNPSNQFKEDCLTLNIWTPYPRRKNMSVMVITINFYDLFKPKIVYIYATEGQNGFQLSTSFDSL